MKRTAGFSTVALAAAFALGCSNGESTGDARELDNVMDAPERLVQVVGCLTAQGEQFVLTDLERAAPPSGGAEASGAASQAATEMYRLEGMRDELRPHVGRQVRVTGEAPPPEVAIVRETSPPRDPRPVAGTTGERESGAAATPETQPQVSTVATTRLEVTELLVRSVSPTGESCALQTGR